MKTRDVIAVELIKEEYGDDLLAIYERGSALYGLERDLSDYDLTVIIKTKLDDVLNLTHYAKQDKIIIDGLELDLLVMSEYKFYSSLKSCTLTHTEILFKSPLYTSEQFEASAEYLRLHAFEILTYSPKLFTGALFGYGKSYDLTYMKGRTVGKSYAMALRFSELLEEALYSEITEEFMRDFITSKDSELREVLIEMKGMETMEEIGELVPTEFKEHYSKLLREVHKLQKELIEEVEDLEVIEEYKGMLLPPVL